MWDGGKDLQPDDWMEGHELPSIALVQTKSPSWLFLELNGHIVTCESGESVLGEKIGQRGCQGEGAAWRARLSAWAMFLA